MISSHNSTESQCSTDQCLREILSGELGTTAAACAAFVTPGRTVAVALIVAAPVRLHVVSAPSAPATPRHRARLTSLISTRHSVHVYMQQTRRVPRRRIPQPSRSARDRWTARVHTAAHARRRRTRDRASLHSALASPCNYEQTNTTFTITKHTKG